PPPIAKAAADSDVRLRNPLFGVHLHVSNKFGNDGERANSVFPRYDRLGGSTKLGAELFALCRPYATSCSGQWCGERPLSAARTGCSASRRGSASGANRLSRPFGPTSDEAGEFSLAVFAFGECVARGIWARQRLPA